MPWQRRQCQRAQRQARPLGGARRQPRGWRRRLVGRCGALAAGRLGFLCRLQRLRATGISGLLPPLPASAGGGSRRMCAQRHPEDAHEAPPPLAPAAGRRAAALACCIDWPDGRRGAASRGARSQRCLSVHNRRTPHQGRRRRCRHASCRRLVVSDMRLEHQPRETSLQSRHEASGVPCVLRLPPNGQLPEGPSPGRSCPMAQGRDPLCRRQ